MNKTAFCINFIVIFSNLLTNEAAVNYVDERNDLWLFILQANLSLRMNWALHRLAKFDREQELIRFAKDIC